MRIRHLSLLYDSLRSITHFMDIHSRSLQKQIGVTAPQLSILIALSDQSPLPISEISKQIHLSVATISGTVIRLEKKGLIDRKPCLDDRRKTLLYLTQRGQNVIEYGFTPLPNNLITNFSNSIPEWEKNMILSAVLKLNHLMQRQE
jgi:DNA-binding MarR family transcriptional regulator